MFDFYKFVCFLLMNFIGSLETCTCVKIILFYVVTDGGGGRGKKRIGFIDEQLPNSWKHMSWT